MMRHLEASAQLVPPRPLTEDEVTDLIAVIIDELDGALTDPSVGTFTDDAGNVRFTVTMDVDAADDYQARARAAAAVRDAFKAAGIVMTAADTPVPALLIA
jgi:hypothetical protein